MSKYASWVTFYPFNFLSTEGILNDVPDYKFCTSSSYEFHKRFSSDASSTPPAISASDFMSLTWRYLLSTPTVSRVPLLTRQMMTRHSSAAFSSCKYRFLVESSSLMIIISLCFTLISPSFGRIHHPHPVHCWWVIRGATFLRAMKSTSHFFFNTIAANKRHHHH